MAPTTMERCRAKLRWAQHHLSVLESQIATFRKAHPTRVTVERDVTRRAYIFRVWDVVEADPAWGLLVGDCVHNARTVLDHLAVQLSLLGQRGKLSDEQERSVAFPIFSDPDKYRVGGVRRVRFMRPKDRERIELLQPYHSWNESIWGALTMPGPPAPIPNYLNVVTELDNADKHRTVQAVWFAPGLSRQPAAAQELGIIGTGTSIEALQEGAEIGLWSFDREPPPIPPEVHQSNYFPIEVSLWQPFFGTRVERILGNCLTAVNMILDMFEPCVTQGAPEPAPLRYWDGGPPWL
jgi:hypothetical protein